MVKILKLVLWVIILGGIGYLIKKFPEVSWLLIGIAVILIIGSWLIDLENN